MCLGVPAKIIKVLDKKVAEAEIGKTKKKIAIFLLEKVKEGDLVLVYNGVAVKILKNG